MGQIRESLKLTINAIDNTTDLFYQQKIQEGYAQLDDTIKVIAQTVNEVYLYKLEGHKIDVDEKKLVDVLNEAMEAMKVKDTILLSDILQYELKEILEKIIASL